MPCRFINYNKPATVVRDVDKNGGCAIVGRVGIWKPFVLLAQFCCEPKTALKNNKVYYF